MNSDIVKITAIICLTILGIVALCKGVDSALLATITSILGGVAGYEYGKGRSTKQ